MATEGFDELQVTAPVAAKSRVLPSTKVPIGLNGITVPVAITRLPGFTDMEVRFDKSTLTVAPLLLMPRKLAKIVAGPPTLLPMAKPLLDVMNTTLDEELKVETLVMSCVVPSLNVPTAVNCS